VLNGIPDIVVDAGVGPTQGGVTFVVPRRNNGPILQLDASNPSLITAISVAYTGWGPTQELEAFRQFATAQSPQDFADALQYFDVGSQNWSYADIFGNIAYFTSGEMPLREDLQLINQPAGLVWPGLIRDGTDTAPHEWLQPIGPPQPNQMLPYEILPFAEMPQVVNPPSGYILNANNDPIGTTLDNVAWNQLRPGGGLYYLSSGYATGYRQGQLQKQFDAAIANDGVLSLEESIAIQANNQLLDAEVFVPHLVAAFNAANQPGADPLLAPLGADPGVVEAIGRLQAWDFSTPTGLTDGYDPGDGTGLLPPPDATEIQNSIAATIYSVWRGQLVQRVIDQSLSVIPPLAARAPGSDQAVRAVRRLLDNFPNGQGIGGVGTINFFSVPGASSQAAARDIVLLGSVRAALDLLASDEFAPAYFNSTDQNEYRWGALHRITFDHPLGGPFSIPPAGGLNDLAPGLPGLARAGGMGVLDASSHSARADGLNEFKYGSGASRRSQVVMRPSGPDIQHVIPGGQSGVLGSPHQADQLRLWLVNAYHPFPLLPDEVDAIKVRTEIILPSDGTNPMPETEDPATATPEGVPGGGQDLFGG
jgi:penicillin amidase